MGTKGVVQRPCCSKERWRPVLRHAYVFLPNITHITWHLEEPGHSSCHTRFGMWSGTSSASKSPAASIAIVLHVSAASGYLSVCMRPCMVRGALCQPGPAGQVVRCMQLPQIQKPLHGHGSIQARRAFKSHCFELSKARVHDRTCLLPPSRNKARV